MSTYRYDGRQYSSTSSIYSDTFELKDLFRRLSRTAWEQGIRTINALEEERDSCRRRCKTKSSKYTNICKTSLLRYRELASKIRYTIQILTPNSRHCSANLLARILAR
ncbi:hypothetical protein F4860DRAFT_474820 [Xylaria cubensis]|nr:hypothetical protein F4860DRAFT_474820 [Xylaria cubensis]